MTRRTDSPKFSEGHGCFTVLIAFGIVVLLGLGVVIFGMGRFVAETESAGRSHYCNEAQLPSLVPFIKNRDIVEYLGHTNYVALETNKYKTTPELKKALPESYTKAIDDALTNGKMEEATDISKVPVTRYYVNKDLLPLEDTRHDPDIGHYYIVMKYRDGSCRFGLLVQIKGEYY